MLDKNSNTDKIEALENAVRDFEINELLNPDSEYTQQHNQRIADLLEKNVE